MIRPVTSQQKQPERERRGEQRRDYRPSNPHLVNIVSLYIDFHFGSEKKDPRFMLNAQT